MLSSFIFKSPRVLAISLLGFSSGLPLALTNSTLQAWFAQSGISLATIGALSLIGIPYTLKFLWSPVMDKVTPPFLWRRRGWISVAQISLCIALFFLANMSPVAHAVWMGQLALFIAFLSASQDIAIDAYRTDTLRPHERGYGSAFFIFMTRISIIVSSGLALILADHIGWRVTYQIMAFLMAVCVMVTYFAPESLDSIKLPSTLKDAIIEPFKDLLKRDAIFMTLLFIVLYKIGDALALQLMSAFLLRELGFTLTDVGIAYKVFGFAASILGALIGGALLERLGLFKSLLLFGLAQAFSNLLFVLLAIVGKQYNVMISTLFVENFCSGMSTIALLVFVTGLCQQKYSATQFACLSALFSMGRIFLGPFAAWLVEQWGWANFYALTFLACFPALILLVLMRTKVTFNAEAIA